MEQTIYPIINFIIVGVSIIKREKQKQGIRSLNRFCRKKVTHHTKHTTVSTLFPDKTSAQEFIDPTQP